LRKAQNLPGCPVFAPSQPGGPSETAIESRLLRSGVRSLVDAPGLSAPRGGMASRSVAVVFRGVRSAIFPIAFDCRYR